MRRKHQNCGPHSRSTTIRTGEAPREAWTSLAEYNDEMKDVLLRIIKQGLVPFSTIINESGDECMWYQEVHPRLRVRSVNGVEEKTEEEQLEELDEGPARHRS